MPHRAPFTNRRLFKNVGCECGNLVCDVDQIGYVAATGMARAQAPAGILRRNFLRENWNSDAAFDTFRTLCASSRCAVREATSTDRQMIWLQPPHAHRRPAPPQPRR